MTNTGRLAFAKVKNLLEYPDFLDIQVKSFQEFFQLETPAENRNDEGLFKVLQRTSLSRILVKTLFSNLLTIRLTLQNIR
jgi:DNA-directed RNA polymerase beta subunit